jgi:uncharacterized membrane protein
MMSQNRQAAKDRLAAALDYEVNVKAETAVAELHDKVDRLQSQLDSLLALQRAALVREHGASETESFRLVA